MKKLIFIILSFLLVSCSYKLYVEENKDGRRVLKTKKFADRFEQNMLNEFDYEKIYFNFYESNAGAYKLYSYLRLFPKGQYAMFYGKTDSMPNLNLIKKAHHVGYYIINNNVLELETPTGNGNTFGYRIIKKYRIQNDSLIEFESRLQNDTLIGIYYSEIKTVEPDW